MWSESKLEKFIDEAEQVWFEVCYSDRKGEELDLNGYIFQVVDDERFDTIQKVELFFNQYWNDKFTKTMMCNLKVLSINGETATLLGDPPQDLPCRVESLRILESRPDQCEIRCVLSCETDRNRVIHYTIQKSENDERIQIVSRTGTKSDCRYQPCNCLLD
ncbi:DL-endopeptidase inhibitor IseA family protein [Paenibacillus aceris]|uniref:Uncharacterized protein n=1 Tax=Paenibacillus aceris TaxID=869555 RepID=A0ABS4I013_9BACL|nr:DL-endopeptidase inhibitor IseA family protein [Paenibacillus aceris]MBP1964225.1 hypothetical protein [Paenibacillus aceris]NHW36550.1 hypothetical protein [Paenibacillus aceris]